MNIAIFSDCYLPQVNGIATSLGLLSEKFIELGHQVTVFVPQFRETNNDPKNVFRVRSIRINKHPPFYLSSPLSVRIIEFFRQESFDIIHAHTPLTMGLLAFQMSYLYGIPLVYTYHTMLLDYLHYIGWLSKTNIARWAVCQVELFSCNTCDLVIAPSRKAEIFLKEERHICTPIQVVPNGVKLDRFRVTHKGYLRSNHNVKKNDKILLCVGRLDKEKNPSFLIRAFALVLHRMKGVKLVFAGSGNLLPELMRLATKLHVNSHVIFLGNVSFDDMPALYADADIFVSAATSEVHPMSLLEAVASGMPVVTINDYAFISTVVHGRNGLLTDLDEQPFAKALLEILQNPNTQQTMSEESCKISEQFSVEAQVNKLLSIYSNLAS